ncbi:TonB-dependent receptor [Gaoshiqia sediminis]|uniref:TonB-dependent receptor n=1 Tax=Gaoshiqia sediminis TaxID=2986998 RepID=A0AA41Y217_9BACT|nr:TonB-dependent receptor [Gaoshiqia sediminis]MCW0482031.1 TonB-dependent receptor [Gaoshiqia sediminis]
MNGFSRLVVAGLLLGSPAVVSAQNAATIKGDSLQTEIHFPIEEVTVQAFRYGHRLVETPGAVAVLSASQLQQNPGQTIAQAINQVPGVYMQSGSLNTNRLTIRGIGSRSAYATNKVRAYYEDIPLTNGVGETTIEDLDQATISRVEIIKGPASGYYGSGLGGTLLFSYPLSPNKFMAESTLSSFGNQLYRSNLTMGNERFQNAFFLEKLNTDGYRENNETQRTNLSYIGKLKANNHLINLIANYTDLMAYIPSSIDLETFHTTPQKAAANWAAIRGYEDYQKWMAGISTQSDWKNNLTTRLSLFGNHRKNDELRPFNRLQENNAYFGGRFIAEKTYRFSDKILKISVGNETFFEDYNWATFANDGREKGKLLSENTEKRKYANFFTQAEYQPSGNLRVTGGFNINHTSYRYTDIFLADGDQSANHRFDLVLSPRLAFNYRFSQNLALYGTVNHGFSPPSLEETLLPDGQRNTDIQPETGWNIEIGSRGFLFEGLFYDLSVYYLQINNLLVARRTADDAWIGINAGKTAHPGMEYALNYQFVRTPTLTGSFSVNGSFTPAYFIDFIDGETDYSDNELTGSPRKLLNLELESSWKKSFRMNLQYSYTGAMPLRDDNSVYTDSYRLLNLIISYQKRWKQVELNLAGAAYNITDTHYASMVLINASAFGNQSPRYYYPGLPRNYSARLAIRYFFGPTS